MANGPFPEGCSELYLVARFPATFDFYSRQIGSQLTVRMCACARFQDTSQSGSAVLPRHHTMAGCALDLVSVRVSVRACVRAMCECVISTGGARGSVSFSMGSFHSQHCTLLTVPVALILCRFRVTPSVAAVSACLPFRLTHHFACLFLI